MQALRLPHLRSSVLSLQLNVGSRFESPSDNGLSHFLEHMLYRGVPRYPTAHELARAFESRGGTLAASTSVDTGVMAIRVPVQSLMPVAELLREVIDAPTFSGIEVERGIVAEEILEGLDDRGQSIDPDNEIRSLVFAEHALGMPITGTAEHVQGFTRASLRSHLERYYSADNMVATVVSPLPTDVVLGDLHRAFGGLRRGDIPVSSAPGDAVGPRFHSVRHSSSQTDLRVGFRAPAYRSADEPVMEVIVRLLDDGMSTRLYHRICDERGLCYDVSAGYETYVDCGLVEFSAGSVHERAPDVLEQILLLLSELTQERVGDEELRLVQQRHAWQFDQMQDDAEAVSEYYGVELLTGEVRLPAARQAQIDGVTAEDIQRVARRWFRADNLHVVVVGAMKRSELARCERLARAF